MQTFMLNSKFSNRVVSVSPQSAKVLEIMQIDGAITRLTAMHYGIANLPARVLDLRTAGIPVVCDERKDAKGSRYGRWSIPSSVELSVVA
jgi:hypothetical protein